MPLVAVWTLKRPLTAFVELSRWVFGRVMNVEMLKIAIDAVAESHTEGHDCDVCKAARGDQDAFGRIALDAFAEEEER